MLVGFSGLVAGAAEAWATRGTSRLSGAAGEARQKVTGLLRTARRAAANCAPAGHAMAEGRALRLRKASKKARIRNAIGR